MHGHCPAQGMPAPNTPGKSPPVPAEVLSPFSPLGDVRSWPSAPSSASRGREDVAAQAQAGPRLSPSGHSAGGGGVIPAVPQESHRNPTQVGPTAPGHSCRAGSPCGSPGHMRPIRSGFGLCFPSSSSLSSSSQLECSRKLWEARAVPCPGPSSPGWVLAGVLVSALPKTRQASEH